MFILKAACLRQFNNTTGRSGIDLRMHRLNPLVFEMHVDIVPG